MNDNVPFTFAQLIEEVNFIEIPILQRDYAQGADAAEDVREAFLDSLEAALVPGATALDLDFVYGSITGESTRTFAVLDGQQRLTTLFLLHWYVALVDGEMDDFRRRWFASAQRRSRFSYATRPSATEFFDALAERPIEPTRAGSTISAALRNERWFLDAWLRDPTVRSACNMLDAIERRFSKQKGLYTSLVQGRQVSFQFLELSNFGLSDDLYIKMNARGKALTPFENLKAWLVERVAREHWAHEFEERLDQRWTDFFWGLSGRGGQGPASFDELFLRFFVLVAFFQAAEKVEGSFYLQKKANRDWLIRLSDLPRDVSLRELEANGALDAASIHEAMRRLDWFSGAEGAAHVDLLVAVLKRPRYEDLLNLNALFSFRAQVDSAQPDASTVPAHLRAWLRVTHNLIANSRFDELGAVVHAVRSLSTLSGLSLDLYAAIAGGAPSLTGFASEQVNEEARKAALIVADSAWEPLLRDAEAHWYLQGRVRSLLHFAAGGDSPAPSQRAFAEYTDAMQLVLTPQILESETFDLQRALLSLYDFMPTLGANRTFCIASATTARTRSENWLPVVEDSRFRKLLDAVREDGLGALNLLIERSVATGWRALVVKDPQLLAYCKLRMVRHTGDGGLLLLSKLRLTAWWTELHTFALARDLQRQLAAGELPGVKGVTHRHLNGDGWPEVIVECDGRLHLSHRAGAWHCVDEEGKDVAPPESVRAALARVEQVG